jgi:3-methyladenine DNA glycosylase AlkC
MLGCEMQSTWSERSRTRESMNTKVSDGCLTNAGKQNKYVRYSLKLRLDVGGENHSDMVLAKISKYGGTVADRKYTIQANVFFFLASLDARAPGNFA